MLSVPSHINILANLRIDVILPYVKCRKVTPHTGFLDLCGEVQQHIRDCITLLDWDDDPVKEISTHLALSQATAGCCVIYDERFWKQLVHRFGMGGDGADATIDLDGHGAMSGKLHKNGDDTRNRWRDAAVAIVKHTTKSHPDRERLQRITGWAQTGHITLDTTVPDYRLNPLFGSLYLNWWTKASYAPEVLNAWDSALSRAFWLAPSRKHPRTANPPLTLLSALSDHAVCSLATTPPTKNLTITFRPDYGLSHESHTEKIEVQREDGVRLVDVIQAMHTWLQAPLSYIQKGQLIRQVREENEEIFMKLEATTDEETLHAWLVRSFSTRGAVITGQFASLNLVHHKDNSLEAIVVCSPRNVDLSHLSANLVEFPL